jgi:hypothetical protein
MDYFTVVNYSMMLAYNIRNIGTIYWKFLRRPLEIGYMEMRK